MRIFTRGKFGSIFYFFAIRDARNMAADVDKALHETLEWYLSSRPELSEAGSAHRLLQASREEGRYLMDAWS